MGKVNGELVLRRSTYDDPDAVKLIAEVQRYYVDLYGAPDESPVRPADFSPPTGLFLIGTVDGQPVACGAWRAHEPDQPGYVEGDAELKRMFVVPASQGNGYARAILAELEATARAEGHSRMVLLTGALQTAAIALYTSSGYARIPNFGVYRDEPECRCFGKPLAAR